MVGGGINGVCANDVGLQLLQQGNIALAEGDVGKGVNVRAAGSRAGSAGVLLVSNALDEKLRTVLVEKFVALGVLVDAEYRRDSIRLTDLHDNRLNRSGRSGGGSTSHHEEGSEERRLEAHCGGLAATGEMRQKRSC